MRTAKGMGEPKARPIGAMPRATRFALALVAVTLAHLLASRLTPGLTRAVDLFLLVVVLGGLSGSSLAGLSGGLAAGLVQDVLTGGLYGLYAFADTIIGYAAARVGQRLVIQRATGMAFVLTVAALVQQGILLLLALLFMDGAEAPDPLWVLGRAVATGATGFVIWIADEAMSTTLDRRRRRRSKIRMER